MGASDVDLLVDALKELHQFIVSELDSDPCADVLGYLSPAAGRHERLERLLAGHQTGDPSVVEVPVETLRDLLEIGLTVDDRTLAETAALAWVDEKLADL